MDSQAPPLTVEQVESLILALYQANQPDVIASTQASLTQLQGSPQAWSIARDLLTRPDQEVKFHGALIIIIKLNTESDALSDDSARELLANLVGWYLDSCSQGTAPLVTRKLASALATFLVHFHHIWTPFVRHLVVCLASGQPVHLDLGTELPDIRPALANLGNAQRRAALWVVGNVVEEASKLDLNSEKNIGLYNVIRQNSSDAVALMGSAFLAQPRIHEDSIKCLQAWVLFVQKASSRDKDFVDALRPLITLVIESLAAEEPVLETIELLSDILSNFSGLLTEQHYSMLDAFFCTQRFHQHYHDLLRGDFEFEKLQYGQLLLAYGDARGCPAVDDKIFVPSLEFWSTFSETVTDETYSAEQSPNPWESSAVSYVLQAVSNAWQKIAFPATEELSQWDSSDRLNFNEARKDVADLLQSTYTLSGPRLVFTFAELVLKSLSERSWRHLEAAAFCLSALADCIKEDPRSDEALASVFASSLFQILQDNMDLPFRTRQTCVGLIEHYTEYFERNVVHLPPALSFLFSLVGEHSLASAASKSIIQLCSSCRRHLFRETGGFLDEYQKLSDSKRLDCHSNVRLSIDSTKLPAARARIGCATGARCFDDAGLDDPALHLALKSLRCLAAIGRGFQSPSEAPIDIDSTAVAGSEGDSELTDLHRGIFSILLQLQNAFSTCSDVTEIICSILRCGFSEPFPGLFVFSREDVTKFLTKHNGNTPRIGVLVSTGCPFVSSFTPAELVQRQHNLTDLLIWVIGLIQQHPDPEHDPELVQNAIDFVSRLLAKSPSTFLHLQPSDMMEYCFLFTLRVLDGKEPLPKAAATDFWTTFVSLNDESTNGLKGEVSQAMATLGPLLCQCIARNIGGNAARSELDKVAEPLKRMVSRYPETKLWLELGLNHPSFPSSKVTLEQKSMFLKKIISLRGARATNQVVRDFWLAARGSNFAYAS
uniref:Importin N-terminal domain-containing protein n=1 Tax=Bionectria ochroleuca TaxID=29856 RepID=A0A8H7K7S9_BIOOC